MKKKNEVLEGIQGHRLEAMIMMAIITGMRKGEIIALRWSDVDLERRLLLVLRTVDYIHGYGYVENEPKTQAGKRLINLLP